MATPLETVKGQFGSKEGLVTRLIPLLDRNSEESDNDFRERLLRVSNTKLLKLWTNEHTVREKFGSREALVDAIVGLRAAGSKPDADYRRKALRLSTGRLLTLHRGLSKR